MVSAPRNEYLPPGDIVAGRFRIDGLIGAGGMGVVYRALDLTLRETVALKSLADAFTEDEMAVARFVQEVRLARRVTHTNVVRVYDVGKHEGRPYITMELVEGITLRRILNEEGRLSPARAVALATAACAGLQAAHEAGVVHRDLKPSNFMVASGGRVVLTDFGIARSVHEASELTQGNLVGTLRYMAPEQMRRVDVDARTDVYSLGLVLHEMLTGEVPLPGVRVDLRKGGVAPTLSLDMLEDVLTRCFAIDPADRFGSARQLGAALARLVFSQDDSDRTFTAVVQTDSRPPLDDGCSIAVLPLRYVGDPEQAYLGETVADELVDLLSRSRGARVLGTGATAPFRVSRDPVAIGRALKVSAIIDGTLILRNGRALSTVRLINAANGVQLWSERMEGDISDLVSFQAALARRAAGALRIELATLPYRANAPSAALEEYLAARRDLSRLDHESARRAEEGFSRCIALAPQFLPALSGHAMASARVWFFDRGSDAARDWESVTVDSVARAMKDAPDLPETHLASGIVSAMRADYADGVRALRRAISIAPTYADAHEYLGMLEAEAGRAAEGLERLQLALALDPGRHHAASLIARDHALHGRFDECDAMLDEVERRAGWHLIITQLLRLRTAAWRGQRPLQVPSSLAPASLDAPGRHIPKLYARALLGQLPKDEIMHASRTFSGPRPTARLRTSQKQLMVEIWMLAGISDEALRDLMRCAASGLVDIEWLDRCPLLDPIRSAPAFIAARSDVLARVESIWL